MDKFAHNSHTAERRLSAALKELIETEEALRLVRAEIARQTKGSDEYGYAAWRAAEGQFDLEELGSLEATEAASLTEIRLFLDPVQDRSLLFKIERLLDLADGRARSSGVQEIEELVLERLSPESIKQAILPALSLRKSSIDQNRDVAESRRNDLLAKLATYEKEQAGWNPLEVDSRGDLNLLEVARRGDLIQQLISTQSALEEAEQDLANLKEPLDHSRVLAAITARKSANPRPTEQPIDSVEPRPEGQDAVQSLDPIQRIQSGVRGLFEKSGDQQAFVEKSGYSAKEVSVFLNHGRVSSEGMLADFEAIIVDPEGFRTFASERKTAMKVEREARLFNPPS